MQAYRCNKKCRLTLLIVIFTLCACSEKPDHFSPEEQSDISMLFETAEPTPAVMQQWSRSCALCHVNGEGGAPRMGNIEEWQDRIAQGNLQLFGNTLYGKDSMPPLGYCMDCTKRDFAALIKFISGQTQ